MRRLLVLAALCCIALLTACDNGDDATPTPTATATATATAEATSSVTVLEHPSPTVPPSIATPTPQATPPSPPGPRRTGDATLDAIIEAVEAHDVDALLGMVELQELECRVEPDMSWHPPCEKDEPEGTIVRGISAGACEGGLVRDPAAVLGAFVEHADGFWALLESDGFLGHRPWGAADRLLVFHNWSVTNEIPPIDPPLYLEIRGGRLIGTGSNCLGTLDDLLRQDELSLIAGPWHEPVSDEGPRRTGDAVLDAVVEAVEMRDVGAIASLVDWRLEPCATAIGMGGPPQCEEGESARTPVRVFPLTTCELEWQRDLTSWLDRIASGTRGLYAAAVPLREATFSFWPELGEADTLLVFHLQFVEGTQDAVRFHLLDGRIVAISFGCGAGEAMYELLRLDEQPPEVIAGPWFDPVEWPSE